ncbi:mCG114051, partial [Mus musculus]
FTQHSIKTNTPKEDPTRDLKQLLQELRTVINEEPAMALSKTEEDGRTPSLGALEPVPLHPGDLEDPSSCFTFTSTASPSGKMSASRSFSSSPKKSPVHSLLTSSAEESVNSTPQYRSTKPIHSPTSAKDSQSPSLETTGKTCQKLQNRLESLQTLVEDLQLKNQAMSSMIRNQEKRIQKVKDQEKMLLK